MVLSKKEKQEIKSYRIKEVFISTAKDIIIKDGAVNVSTRKIADASGYSLGTIYNYFKNIDELLWQVRSKLIIDINNHIKSIISSVSNVNELVLLFSEFIKYFTNNPNIYEFFYLYKLNPQHKPSNVSDYNIDIISTFEFLLKDGYISRSDIHTLSMTIIYSVYGMLTMYFSQNDTMDEQILNTQIESIIRYLVDKHQKI